MSSSVSKLVYAKVWRKRLVLYVSKETSTNFANKQALANGCLEVYASHIIGGQ